jgi:drug/metabolite transporter (DMT)-like permease
MRLPDPADIALSAAHGYAYLIIQPARSWLMQPPVSNYSKGAAFGLAAASIWAGWSPITRLGVTTQLDACDVAILRFGVAGVVLIPMVLWRGLALDCIGRRGLALMLIGGGVPYVLLAATGLAFAPAHDQAALNPGTVPLFVALIGVIAVGEKVTPNRRLGLFLIAAGATLFIGWYAASWDTSRTLGHALGLAAALLWACFSVVISKGKLDSLHAAALVSTGSLLLYLPVYLVIFGTRLSLLPTVDLAVQAIYQGVLVTIVSLVCYGNAMDMLGTSGGAAFGALVPVLSALLAIPLLGEWPNPIDWPGMLLVCVGVYLASGGPVPSRTHRNG